LGTQQSRVVSCLADVRAALDEAVLVAGGLSAAGAVVAALRDATVRLDAARGMLAALEDGGDGVHRREFLAVAASAAGVAGMPADLLGSLTAAARVPLDEHARVATALAARYDLTPLPELTDLVGGHVVRVRRSLSNGAVTAAARARATGLFAEAVAFNGWLSFAAGHRASADRDFVLAAGAAGEASDGVLQGAALMSRAETLVNTHPACPRPRSLRLALDLAEGAVGLLAGSGADARLRAWAAARYATLAAADGSGGVFFEQMDSAREWEGAPVDLSASGVFTAAGRFSTMAGLLATYDAAGLFRLGRVREALDLFLKELERLGSVRGFGKRRANAAAGAAACLLGLREVDAAAGFAVEAAEQAGAVAYGQGWQKVRFLREGLARHGSLPAVSRLDELLAAA